MDALDIVLLTYNRLEYLVATVEALRERTPEPFRLTIVDNASGSAVRNWLVEHGDLFHQVIFQPQNEHIAGFQRGIDTTSSDPFVLAEPDLIVPDLEPSWLARLRALMDRHPDFGLIGVGLDTANRPAVLGPETFEASAVVDGEVVESNVGIWFQMIRREALRVPYVKDSAACMAIREAGFRVGWTPKIRAFHLGWDDHRTHPTHLVSKNELPSPYPHYREVELIGRPPAIEELARAAPVVGQLRRAGVASEAVLELAWGAPVLGPALDAVRTLHPPPVTLPLGDGAAGAVVLVAPPAEIAADALAEAARVATTIVVAVVSLATFDGRAAADVAPAGWTGHEVPAVGRLPLELARRGDELPALKGHLRYTTLEHRDSWLALFAAAAIPPEGEERLFVFTAEGAVTSQDYLTLGHGLVPWKPPPRPLPTPKAPSWRWKVRHGIATRAPVPVVRAFRRVGRRQR
ncbi:MAG TPA: glycosyltransferase [Gaiellaceae bacterium]